MHSRRTILTAVAAAAGAAVAGGVARASGLAVGSVPRLADVAAPATRNVFQWPFAQNSIWNMPIGDGAQYYHPRFQTHNADIPAAEGDQYISRQGYRIEQEIICLTPDAPLTEVWWNEGSFDDIPDRCVKMKHKENGQTELLDRIPIPASWAFHEGSNANESKINGCFVGIRPPNDQGVVKELVGVFAFARCTAGGIATGRDVSSSTTGRFLRADRLTGSDIFGEGRFGEHGGTHLSVLGGALRLGELRPGGGRIRHALKIILPRQIQFHAPPGQDNWVWPAFNGDKNDNYHGTDPRVRPGALYALPPTLNINQMGFETEPGLQIAWTMQNYGAYHHDCTPAQTCALGVEVGPAGDFRNQFLADWGYPMIRKATVPENIEQLRKNYTGWDDRKNTGPWIRDLDRIFSNMHRVINNGPNSIGGGGMPRQPLAPPFE